MQRLLPRAPHELAALGYTDLSLVSETEDFLLYRAAAPGGEHVLIKIPASGRPPAAIFRQLEHELEVARELNPDFVVRPLKIERSAGQAALILEDCPYPPLTELLKTPLTVEPFLRAGAGVASALAEVHSRGLVHKDIRPVSIFVTAAGKARLTGFGIASKLPREQQPPAPPEVIAGTLAYMAPGGGGRLCERNAKARPRHRGLAYNTFLDKERSRVPVAGASAFVGRLRAAWNAGIASGDAGELDFKALKKEARRRFATQTKDET